MRLKVLSPSPAPHSTPSETWDLHGEPARVLIKKWEKRREEGKKNARRKSFIAFGSGHGGGKNEMFELVCEWI
jgi:hypothetical protein